MDVKSKRTEGWSTDGADEARTRKLVQTRQISWARTALLEAFVAPPKRG
jgi:hypothetical protein